MNKTFAVVPLLFLHGFNCDPSTWDHQIEFFKDRYKVYTPDLPFHGTSSVPAEPTVEGLAEAMIAFIEKEKMGAPIVIGHSLGGMVALQMALRSPQSLRALVLADAFPSLAVNRRFLPSIFGPDTPSTVREQALRVMDRGREKMPTPIQDRIWESIEKTDVTERLGEIQIPILGIYGGRDLYRSEDASRLKHDLQLDQLPQCEVVILEGMGHFVQMEAPEAFNRALDEYNLKLEK